MQALLFDGKEIRLKDVDLEGENEVKAVGICGTDIAFLKGTYKPRKLPIVLGHEFSIKKDKRLYTSEINIVDWSCEYCKKGMYTHCKIRKAIGIDVDGAMRERVSLPDYLLHENKYGLSEVELALTEPTAAVLRMVELVKPSPDWRAMVIGDGPIGIISGLVLKGLGIDVHLKGKHEERMRIAENVGLTVVREISENYDIVVEATGGNVLNEALKYVKPMGVIAMKSTHGADVAFNSTTATVNEIRLVGSRCGPFYLWDKAMKSIRELKFMKFITVYEFNEYEEAFKDVIERKVVKAVLKL